MYPSFHLCFTSPSISSYVLYLLFTTCLHHVSSFKAPSSYISIFTFHALNSSYTSHCAPLRSPAIRRLVYSFYAGTEEWQKNSFILAMPAVSSCRTNHSGLHGCTVNRIKSPMARAKASRGKRGRPVADTAYLGWGALGH